MPAVDAHELDVRALGEARVRLEQGPEAEEVVARRVSSRMTACGLPTDAVVSSTPVDGLRRRRRSTAPNPCRCRAALSIRAVDAGRRRDVTSVAPVRPASQRAAIRTPLPDISAVEPSGFQIVTSAASSRVTHLDDAVRADPVPTEQRR